jgi:heat shock protein HslJ
MKFRKFFKTVSFLFLLHLLTGCQSPSSPVDNPLCNIWHFPKAPVPVRISFTPDNRMVGIMGLNNFFAPVRYLPKGAIEIHAIALTRRGEYPDFADRFFKILRSARFAGVKGDKLYLFDGEKKKIMTLTRFDK